MPVKLTTSSYDILIGQNLLEQAEKFIAESCQPRRAAIVSNPVTMRLYGRSLGERLESQGVETVCLTVPAGERFKTAKSWTRVIEDLATNRLERRDAVIALGGGVVGDLVGFAAASYLRGVPLVQVPTTLLAQVDSSVGGKTGFNLPQGKNLVGAFYQPRLVLIDPATLSSLPTRQLRAGMAEVVKYGIIWDEELFKLVESNSKRILDRDSSLLEIIIGRSCQIKAEVVRQDEKEDNLRAILNFGHTLGHALESALGYGKLLHGEAISIGMIAAANLSEKLGFLAPGLTIRIKQCLQSYALPVAFPAGVSYDNLESAMLIDKKISAGQQRWVLAKGFGDVFVSGDVPISAVRETIEECKE